MGQTDGRIAASPNPRVSISQDYWGEIKDDWESGSFLVKIHIIFALKYNKATVVAVTG